MAAARHRVAQFWLHTSGRVAPADNARAAAILGIRLAPLFLNLPINERRHGLAVLRTMEALGESDPVLLQAALLHDMGKAEAGISVLDRSLAVFLTAVSPRLFDLYLRLRPAFRRRYGIYRDHAAIGAARLRALGAEELAAVIAEHHLSQPVLEATRRLRQADSLN